ncbi:hypothetical protein OS493_028172, partial [Desmophyllum pertusum]
KPSEEVEIGDDGEYEDYSVTDDIVLLKGDLTLGPPVGFCTRQALVWKWTSLCEIDHQQRGNGTKGCYPHNIQSAQSWLCFYKFLRMPSHASASATVRCLMCPIQLQFQMFHQQLVMTMIYPEFGAAQSMPTTEQKVARLAAVFPVIPCLS